MGVSCLTGYGYFFLAGLVYFIAFFQALIQILYIDIQVYVFILYRFHINGIQLQLRTRGFQARAFGRIVIDGCCIRFCGPADELISIFLGRSGISIEGAALCGAYLAVSFQLLASVFVVVGYFVGCALFLLCYQVEGTVLHHSAIHCCIIQRIYVLVRSGIFRHSYDFITVSYFEAAHICCICNRFVFQLMYITGFLMGVSCLTGYGYFFLAGLVYFIAFFQALIQILYIDIQVYVFILYRFHINGIQLQLRTRGFQARAFGRIVIDGCCIRFCGPADELISIFLGRSGISIEGAALCGAYLAVGFQLLASVFIVVSYLVGCTLFFPYCIEVYFFLIFIRFRNRDLITCFINNSGRAFLCCPALESISFLNRHIRIKRP